MGTEVTNWSERLAESAKEVAALERPSLSTISVRGGMMQYMNQPVPGNKLDVVIVASAFQNRYYDKPFDPNKPANPVCFALSLDGQDMVPSDESSAKQHPTCDGCPMNEWGSDPRGGRGKACKAARRLAVIPASVITAQDANPAAVKKAEMALLTLPVMSGKNWANYVNVLNSEYARPPWAVISEVRTEPDARSQFQVKFQPRATITDEFLGAIHDRIEMAQTVLLTPYDDSGTSEQQAAEPKAGRKY